jgi:hypothetical protein
VTTARTKQRTLIVIDPVECGTAAFERALAAFDPTEHEVTLTVVATPPRGGEPDAPTIEGVTTGFENADRALAGYLDRARSMGFTVEGWVVPPRRSRIAEETQARGRFDQVVAVSPSGTWRRLRGDDVARVLARSHSVPVAVACEN